MGSTGAREPTASVCLGSDPRLGQEDKAPSEDCPGIKAPGKTLIPTRPSSQVLQAAAGWPAQLPLPRAFFTFSPLQASLRGMGTKAGTFFSFIY